MLAVAVGGEAAGQTEVRLSTGDQIENTRADDCADDLGDDVAQKLVGGEASARPQADRHGGIEMSSRDRAERIRAGEHGEAERERDAEKANAYAGKSGREHRAS